MGKLTPDNFVERHSPFRSESAIAAVLDASYPLELRALLLAQLLVWAILDQKASDRSRTKPRYANRTLLLYSTILLWNNWKSGAEHSAHLTKLFKAEGGVRQLLAAMFRVILNRVEKATAELEYVYHIVDYLCRSEAQELPPAKRTINCAFFFVRDTVNAEKTYSKSAIEKAWHKYKGVAPLIYGFWNAVLPMKRRPRSPKQAKDCLEALISKGAIQTAMGKAAFSSHVISRIGHDIPTDHFAGIKPVKPRLHPFSNDEQAIINRFDPKALTKSDLRDYRAQYKKPHVSVPAIGTTDSPQSHRSRETSERKTAI